MTIERTNQGDLDLLDHPVARRLLESSVPARLGYIATDGTPRVTPMWFAWNGHAFVLGAAGSSPKVTALAARPRVALTIDTHVAPYEALYVRGNAEIERVDGVVTEYAEAALRYLGPEHGAAFAENASANFTDMARISIRPDWVGLVDFRDRFPSSYEGAT
ncbi:MAG: pyridoxamine 5'-phosphate oxidase [Acidimicrobiia bacterium]|nr:pyridoxamine 5'-phosphate oxidase [Acidimicrobiia bacterium]